MHIKLSTSVLGRDFGQLQKQIETRAEQNLAPKESQGFADEIGDAINDVARAQKQASELTQAYELGLETDLSKVMVQKQISSLGFQMTLNVRNKVLSAYKDIMNMPV